MAQNIALLLLCSAIFTTADYFSAKWGYSKDGLSLTLVLLIGPFGYLVFGYLAATTSLAKMSGYANVGIVMFTTATAVFLLGERPNRLTWIGLATIILGLIILAVGKVELGGAATPTSSPPPPSALQSPHNQDEQSQKT